MTLELIPKVKSNCQLIKENKVKDSPQDSFFWGLSIIATYLFTSNQKFQESQLGINQFLILVYFVFIHHHQSITYLNENLIKIRKVNNNLFFNLLTDYKVFLFDDSSCLAVT